MKQEQTTIRLPVELKEKLQQEADARGYPIKDLVMFIFYYHYYGAIVPE